MIPDEILRAQVDPAPKLLLFFLWTYAPWKGDPEEEGGAFVYPTIDKICDGLGSPRSTVYRSLAKLIELGWVERSTRTVRRKNSLGGPDDRSVRGFWLRLAPRLPSKAKQDAWTSEGWDDGSSQDGDDDVPASGPEPSQSRESHPLQEYIQESPRNSRARAKAPARAPSCRRPPPKRDDDASGIARQQARADALFRKYEGARVARLGGMPARIPTERDTGKICTLVGHVMRRFGRDRDEAWSMVETYAERSLELAAEARRRDREIAPALVAARCDGSEWSPDRFDAVLARSAPPVQDEKPRFTRAPATIDDEPMTADEEEIWLDVANRTNVLGALEAVQERRRERALRDNPQLGDWSGPDAQAVLERFLASLGKHSTGATDIAGPLQENT